MCLCVCGVVTADEREVTPFVPCMIRTERTCHGCDGYQMVGSLASSSARLPEERGQVDQMSSSLTYEES